MRNVTEKIGALYKVTKIEWWDEKTKETIRKNNSLQTISRLNTSEARKHTPNKDSNPRCKQERRIQLGKQTSQARKERTIKKYAQTWRMAKKSKRPRLHAILKKRPF